MVLIKAAGYGFTMGLEGRSDATPHIVKFTKDFWMDTKEVTQGGYVNLMNAYYPEYDPWPYDSLYDPGTGDDHPAYYVSWFDAVLYCNARSLQEGLDPVYQYTGDPIWKSNGQCSTLVDFTIDYSQNGYKLPTEAQWEYAARGGTSTLFFWGNSDDIISEYAISPSNSTHISHPVAQKLSNNYGLYDVSGNVQEWCNDFYDSTYYSSAPVTDPIGPVDDAFDLSSFRVIRGGYYMHNSDYLQSGFRKWNLPYSIDEFTGFRVIRNASAAN